MFSDESTIRSNTFGDMDKTCVVYPDKLRYINGYVLLVYLENCIKHTDFSGYLTDNDYPWRIWFFGLFDGSNTRLSYAYKKQVTIKQNDVEVLCANNDLYDFGEKIIYGKYELGILKNFLRNNVVYHYVSLNLYI